MTGIESQFKCQMITKLLNNAIDNHLHLQQKLFKEFKDYTNKYFKFVGLKIDELLNWDYQIEHVSNKIASSIFALNQIKNILPLNIRLLVSNALTDTMYRFHVQTSCTDTMYRISCIKTRYIILH